MKKCNKCQRNVEDPQVSRSYHEIIEYDLKSTLGEIEQVSQVYCCEPCWYHGKESEKYLNKPYYSINHHRDNTVSQTQPRVDLIIIYKEMEAKGIKNIDLKELEELFSLRETLKAWGSDAPINQQNKSRREELERKYSVSSSGSSKSSNFNSTTAEKEKESNSSSKQNYLPWILGGIGAFVLIGWLIWYFKKGDKK